MAAPKGHKKWGGRAKGTPNKNKSAILAIATKSLGKEPIEELCQFYKDSSDPALKLGALKEICTYCHPKLKSTEVILDGEVQHEASEEVISLFKSWIKLAKGERDQK